MSVNVAELRIRQYPDPVLRRRARPVEVVNDEVRAVADRMIELMHEAEGVGLAAPQVGLSWRMFVTHVTQHDEPPRVFVNPVMKVVERELSVREEGCLSIPGIHVDIRRPVGIHLTAMDAEGAEFSDEDHDFRARVWQHELDHLDGVLIIDRLSPLDRLAKRKAIRQLEQSSQ